MARIAVEQLANTSTYSVLPTYDSTKWSLGHLIKGYTGSNLIDRFIGPHKIAQAKPYEESISALPFYFIDGYTWSNSKDWVFLLENTTTGTTRRIFGYEYNRDTSSFNWLGSITFTLNTAATHTTRGFAALYYTHNTGTVSVSGSTVTGTNTLFVTQRIGAGARIGFGSTNPNLITTWYKISTIVSDTSITLSTSVPSNISAGSTYVIEELRFVITTSNSSVLNGGLFIAKGIAIDDFTAAGTTIGAYSSTVDNTKAVYWLADSFSTAGAYVAGTTSNTAVACAAPDGNKKMSFDGLTHSLYTLDVTSSKCYQYNVRASDTITAGKMALTFSGGNIIITGTQTFTGTLAQVNNGIVETVNHSAGAGDKSLYFVTTTRVYRASTSNITHGNITWQSSNRVETAPGGSSTIAVTGALSTIDYDNVSDRFLFLSTNLTAFKSYYSYFPVNSGDQFEYVFLNDFKLFDGSTADTNIVPLPFNTNSNAVTTRSINGITYLFRVGTAVVGGPALFAIPMGAHWDFASSTNQVAISPAISTPNNNKFVKIVVNKIDSLGTNQFVTPLNALRFYYRTAGISDNSGSWTAIDASGDLSSVSGTSQIQFKFEFQMLGQCFGIPARLLGFMVVYEDLSTDSHYQPSVTYSSESNKRFAWRFATSFGSTVPALRVRLFDAVTGGLLVDDNTTSPTGTFEQSTNDGVTWASWTNTDRTNNTTYLRYTPASLADNIKVRALLTLN